MTPPERRRELLATARDSIGRRLRGEPLPEIPERPHAEESSHGVFVTIRSNGELRGCIGTLAAEEGIRSAVSEFAVQAGFEDPRFPPLTAEEWNEIRIEISILSPPRLIEEAQFETGRHGLILEIGARRGLLLPQVAEEWSFTREQFLGALSRKAGLPEDGWKLPGAKLYAFEAEVFGEHEANRGE
ncbi:MAG: AmmeMemoRadiSam system protein A [Thermoanaerobaculia bacterium]